MEISNGEHTLSVPVSGGPMPVVFCFDLNGSLVYGWDDGSGYTWAYFDELEADWREVYLPGVHDLCCAVDHYTAEGGDSGVVLMYTRGTEVLVRYQVERYQVEHLFMVLEKPVPLRTIGLSPEYRFSIRFEDKVEVALFPDQLEGYVPPDQPDPPDPGTGDFIGGLDPAQGWYRYSHSPVELGSLFDPYGVSVVPAATVEATLTQLKGNLPAVIDLYGEEFARTYAANQVASLFNLHNNIVPTGSTLEYPVGVFSGQPNEGAASTWTLHEVPGSVMYVYGVDQEQVYLDTANPTPGWVPPPKVFSEASDQLAWAYRGCEGIACPVEITLNWTINRVTEINTQAILDWLFNF